MLVDLELGRATAEAIWGWSAGRGNWCHRKVESLRLLEGERGRRRVSLDCTPPPDPGLAFEPNDRQTTDIDGVEGPLMVPIAMIAKLAMRDLDVQDADGRPMPVLGREQDSTVGWSAACYALVKVGVELTDSLRDELYAIVSGAPGDAEERAEHLLSTGVIVGERLFDADDVPELVTDLIRDLAKNFLLVVLLPSKSAGVRQVIKYSSHWQPEGPAAKRTGWDRFPGLSRTLVAFGYTNALFALEVSGAMSAASYHLEVHAPPGLICAGLRLPDGPAGEAEGNDHTTDVVAHAFASYPEGLSGDQTARLYLAVPATGLRLLTTLVALFTASVFVLERALPGAQTALLEAADGAVALLLAAPAVVLALLARPGENAIAASLLWPLRFLVLICASLLTAGAASLVGHLHDPYLTCLWTTGASLGVLASLALIFAPRLVRSGG
jgi:hypothetical protein